MVQAAHAAAADAAVARGAALPVTRWPEWANPSVTIRTRRFTLTIYAAGVLLALAVLVVWQVWGFDDGVRYIIDLGF